MRRHSLFFCKDICKWARSRARVCVRVLPGPPAVQVSPWDAARCVSLAHAVGEGLSEGKAEQEVSCRCFSASGNCLRFSLSKQNAAFFTVGTTFPSPLGGLFMQVFIHSVVGYRQLSRETEKPLLALPCCRGKK